MRQAGQGGSRASAAARAAITCAIVVASVALASNARAECSREMLQGLARRHAALRRLPGD